VVKSECYKLNFYNKLLKQIMNDKKKPKLTKTRLVYNKLYINNIL